MALTFTAEEQVTADLETQSGSDFVYGLDRSVYFLWGVETPAVDPQHYGLFLTKRKRDGTYLPPLRVDWISTDAENIDVIAGAGANRPRSGNSPNSSCIDVDRQGNIHITWRQIGRGGSVVNGICYRKITYDGNDDSYGTLGPVKYWVKATAIATNQFAMCVNKVDGTIWIAYTNAADNKPYSTYFVDGDAEGLIDSAREKALPFHPSITGTPICQDKINLFADGDGNVHAVTVNTTNAQNEITYLGRTLDDPKPGDTATDPDGWSVVELVATATGSAAISRGYVSVAANSMSDVIVGWLHQTATDKQFNVGTRLGGWLPTIVSGGGTALNRLPAMVAQTQKTGYAIAVWFEDVGSAADGLFYNILTNGVWGAATQAISRSAAGGKGYSTMTTKFRRFPRSPFQLGMQNPIDGRLGVCWLQRDA